MSIKSRQVAGVTTLVVFIVAALSAYHLATLARLSLQESAARGELLRAGDLPARARGRARRDGSLCRAARGRRHPLAAPVERRLLPQRHLRGDREPRRRGGRAQLHVRRRQADPRAGGSVGRSSIATPWRSCAPSIPIARSRSGSRSCFGEQQFGSIRIGISTLLVKDELRQGVQDGDAGGAVRAASSPRSCAMLLAQWMLRPIHVIQSGLTRLGRGELDVRLDLPEGSEFKDLGSSFDAVSAQLSESRAKAPSPPHRLRVRRRQPRGRRRALRPGREADVLQSGDERTRAARVRVQRRPCAR